MGQARGLTSSVVSSETVILLWLFCAAIGAAIAKSKNRNWTEGLLLGGLLGVIGVIIELFMSAQGSVLPPSGWYPDPEGSDSQRFWNGREWGDLPPRPANSRAPQAVDAGAAVQGPTKKCPDCAETILAAANVCKHCGYRVTPPSAPDTSQKQEAPRGKSETVIPSGKSTKVKCHNCQHVQTVLQSESAFACEQCNTKLKRRIT
jgi:ribosomal protein S27E